MNTTKPKDLGVMINVPTELAQRIFIETGDLSFAKFPAIMTLADIIGNVLKTNKEAQVAVEPKVHVRRVACA